MYHLCLVFNPFCIFVVIYLIWISGLCSYWIRGSTVIKALYTYHILWLCAKIGYMYTVPTATFLPPGCVLPSPVACIQVKLNTTTCYGKIGTFEAVRIQLWPCLVTTDYSHSAAMSHNITQPCALAMLVLMHAQSAEFYCSCVGEFLAMAYSGLLWSFTAGFYFEIGQLRF